MVAKLLGLFRADHGFRPMFGFLQDRNSSLRGVPTYRVQIMFRNRNSACKVLREDCNFEFSLLQNLRQ